MAYFFKGYRRFFHFLFVIQLIVINVSAQTFQDANNAVELSDEFDEKQGRLTFYADNKDFCEYSLYVSFIYSEGFAGMPKGRPVVISHGKEQIMNYKVMEGATRYGYRYEYAMYRGNYDKLPNVDFSYALPAANDETVFAELKENQEGYQIFFDLPSDTLYACRGGMVCNDELKDNTAKGFKNFNDNRTLAQITLYHADGSFGEYVFKGKLLVFPGQNIKIGSPIAIIVKEVDKYPIRFSTYFLDKNKMKDSNIGNKHSHFRPFFQSYNNGKSRLENGKNYICELTDEMVMQDMSKRERNKYLNKMSKENNEKK